MWQVVLTDTAVRQLRRVPKSERGPIKDGIRRHLVESDPAEPTRDKFRLRRVSEHAEFELRIEPWRVFYRIREDLVEVVLIGERKGNKLIIGGEEFIL